MKTILFGLIIFWALIAFATNIHCQEYIDGKVFRWSYPGVDYAPYGSDCDNRVARFTPVSLDTLHDVALVYDLGQPFKLQEAGGIFIEASIEYGTELVVSTSYNDWNNRELVSAIGGRDGIHRYQLPFRCGPRGAQYIIVARHAKTREGELNGQGYANVDCLAISLAHSAVKEQESLTIPVQWYNVLGKPVFFGTAGELRAGHHGAYFSRTAKCLIP